ncbi:hypothetical protein DFH08DRAFT_894869 [Mycena albidolilacea]|uniref:Uncharacterized protein n=1 Tax=Mycena albidolilacea TaxID=1033008 RepID=A0AAD7EDH1_9AGAR|nr:hypothetical protein DFH08DRAFT_894869 [Mycena albidolilacea]
MKAASSSTPIGVRASTLLPPRQTAPEESTKPFEYALLRITLPPCIIPRLNIIVEWLGRRAIELGFHFLFLIVAVSREEAVRRLGSACAPCALHFFHLLYISKDADLHNHSSCTGGNVHNSVTESRLATFPRPRFPFSLVLHLPAPHFRPYPSVLICSHSPPRPLLQAHFLHSSFACT